MKDYPTANLFNVHENLIEALLELQAYADVQALLVKYDGLYRLYYTVVVVVVVTRSDQPKPPAVAIVRQNGLSSASCRASVAVTPMSRQIWWIQVVGDRPLAHLHSCEGRSPSLAVYTPHTVGHQKKTPIFCRNFYNT